MDRTTVFNSTVAAAAHRQDEKSAGDEIHRNLHALALIHPHTDDLKRLLSPEMFLKPNSAAFAHVFHYLFKILDAREFRRSFRWPCSDKQDESTFRTAAVVLMNALIDRHKLPLEPVKMHSVVLPGGLKFMRIVYEFTAQAMRDTVAKHCPPEDDNVNMYKDLQECREYQANVTKYLQKLNVSLATIQNAYQAVQTALYQIEPLITTSAVDDWAAQLDDTFARQLLPAYDSITEFSRLCGSLADLVQSIASNKNKRCVSVDAAALKRCQEQLAALVGDEIATNARLLCVNNEFDYAQIVSVFEAVLPTIAGRIAGCRYRTIAADTAAAERQLLDQMTTEVSTLKLNIDSQMQRTEAYFQYAHQKYPEETLTAAMAASVAGTAARNSATIINGTAMNEADRAPTDIKPVVHSGLDMRSRFLCTPPVRLKCLHTASNSIMNSHLPWTLDAQPSAPTAAKIFNDTTEMLFNRPTTPQRHNQSKRTAGSESVALGMLARVLDRCHNKSDAQCRSSALAVNSSTLSNASQLIQSQLNVDVRVPSAAVTPMLLSGSPQPSSAMRTLVGSDRKTPTTASALHQYRGTLSAAKNSNGSVVGCDFLHTSPSGRFVCADIAIPTVTVDAPVVPPFPLSAATATEPAETPDNGSISPSTTVTARKIVFSPDASVGNDDDTDTNGVNLSRSARLSAVLSPDVAPFRILSGSFGEESLANVSDSVLQYSPM